jgi:hypothetical protein
LGKIPLVNAAEKMAVFQVVQKRWYNDIGLPLKTQNFKHDEGSVRLQCWLMPTGTLEPLVLPRSWYAYRVNDGVDEKQSGLYEWKIEGRGSYIGKYKRITRPTKEYGRNVTKILEKRPYRSGNRDGFRRIHHELAEAHRDGRKIILIILENPRESEINRRERELIAERGALNNSPHGRTIDKTSHGLG